MRRQLLSVALCVGLLASCAPAALAQGTNAPPGNSGIDQYLETVPEAGGNRPRRDGDGASRLPARTVQRLKKAGADGKAVAELVASTGTARSGCQASPSERSGTKSGAKRDPGASGGSSSPPSSSVPGTIAAPTVSGSGSGGLGIVLPLLLALSAFGAVFFALRRRDER